MTQRRTPQALNRICLALWGAPLLFLLTVDLIEQLPLVVRVALGLALGASVLAIPVLSIIAWVKSESGTKSRWLAIGLFLSWFALFCFSFLLHF